MSDKLTDISRLVSVKCGCCASFDKTVMLDMFGDFRRTIEVWRCGNCGQPCSNRLCNGFQTDSFEELRHAGV